MSVQNLLKQLREPVQPAPSLSFKGRAAKGTTPLSLKLKLSEGQRAKLQRAADSHGISAAMVLRGFIDALP